MLDDGHPIRFDDGLAVQRAKCGRCRLSWTLWPAFLYPQRSLQPDVVESAALTYLADESATYKRVASCFRVFSAVDLALGRLASRPARRAAAPRRG